MNIAVFSTKPYDRRTLAVAAQQFDRRVRQAQEWQDERRAVRGDAGTYLKLDFHEDRLTEATAPQAEGTLAVCAFVNDVLDRPCLEILHNLGIGFIAMRCAGFNNIDLDAARELGFSIGRVPAYSPYAVAEHAVALLLMLNRHLHKSYNRIREYNFALEGLLGFDLHGKTVGVVGTGKIGVCFVRIMLGFGCKVLAHDPFPSPEMAGLPVQMVELSELLTGSDIISLHCPLMPATRHLITTETLAQMKPGAFLINTSRGGLVNTAALVESLALGHLGAAGLDVYEDEASLFFEDRSGELPLDETFNRLLTFPNVVVTGHQAFFTQEALANIATTTMRNLTQWEQSGTCDNIVP